MKKYLCYEKNKIVALMTIVWSILSLVCGSIMIRRYYELGLQNQYDMQLNIIEQIFWTVVAYLFAVLSINRIILFIVNAILFDQKERKIIIYSIPFVILFGVAFITKYFVIVSQGQLYNYYDLPDERNIWDAAVRLYPFFFVYTSEVFLLCFFILPTALAPAIIKPICDALVLGYVVYRIMDRYNSRYAYLIYLLMIFLMGDFSICTRVHRMYWYAFLYLFFSVKLYFDKQTDRNSVNWYEITVMIFIVSILTVWRREGIYLLLFGAIELVYVYVIKGRNDKERKVQLHKIIVLFVVAEILVYAPAINNGISEKMTTYEAYFVHMMGEESLKRDRISEELEIADGYMDIDIVDKYNYEFGIHAYDDCMYAWEDWKDGSYYAVRKDRTISNEEFASVVVRMIFKEPIVFIKSRIKAFHESSGMLFYNLYIPLICLFFVFLYSVYTKDRLLFMLSIGVIIHITITIMTMPASYFKYFYEMILFAYVFTIIVFVDFVTKKLKNQIKSMSWHF